MSNIQIPNLPAVVSLSGAELFEGVQTGTSVKISLTQIVDAARIGGPASIPILINQGGTGATTAPDARTNLGLGTIATQDASNVTITGGSITGITDLSVADGGTGASTAPDARTNLGLGTIATQNANNVTITGGSISGITDLAVADGGTGVSTLTGYVKGNGTAAFTASTTVPSSDITGLGTMSTQNSNNVTITGGTITGITDLAVADGGTGQGAALTQYGVIYGDTTASMASTLAGTSVQVLHGNASGAPTWGAVSLTADVSDILPVANGGTNISSYTIGDILYASATGVLSSLADVATGNALISGGVGAAPSYGKIGLTTHVSGVLPVANGGTGNTSAPAEAARLLGFTSTDVAVGGVSLTSTSSQYQLFFGSGGLFTVDLPDTSTLQAGWSFHIVNNCTAGITFSVRTFNGVSPILSLPVGVSMMVTCISTADNSATSWEAGLTDFTSATGTGSVVLATSPVITTPTVANGTISQVNAIRPAGTLTLAFATAQFVQVTPNATGTFTTTVPVVGTTCTLIILTSGVTSYTMTFGTGFKTVGTLATGTVSARYFVFQFVSDGTSLIESSRTVAIA